MRINTGEKPAQLQVRSECSHPTNIGFNDNLILTILMVICAQTLQCHENTYSWEARQTTGAGRSYSLTKHGRNDKNNFHCSDGGMHSVSSVPCGYILMRNVYNYGYSQGLSLQQTQLIVTFSTGQFHHCHETTYQCETCTTAGALKIYNYPTNRIVCIW